MTPSEGVRQRFWARIEIPDPDACWVWTGPRDTDRFGVLVEPFDGLTEAHDAAWYFVNGPVPDGLWVLHYCENPPCCNPKHLFAGADRPRRSAGDVVLGSTSRRARRRVLRAATHPSPRDRYGGHDVGGFKRFV